MTFTTFTNILPYVSLTHSHLRLMPGRSPPQRRALPAGKAFSPRRAEDPETSSSSVTPLSSVSYNPSISHYFCL